MGGQTKSLLIDDESRVCPARTRNGERHDAENEAAGIAAGCYSRTDLRR
jgi:hypothetical protein